MNFAIGDKAVKLLTRKQKFKNFFFRKKYKEENCTAVSLEWGKVTVQFNDKFKSVQILEEAQLRKVGT